MQSDASMTTIIVSGDGDLLVHQSIPICVSDAYDRAFIGVLSKIPFQSVILYCKRKWRVSGIGMLI